MLLGSSGWTYSLLASLASYSHFNVQHIHAARVLRCGDLKSSMRWAVCSLQPLVG
jgi:hypothetical protein